MDECSFIYLLKTIDKPARIIHLIKSNQNQHQNQTGKITTNPKWHTRPNKHVQYKPQPRTEHPKTAKS